MKNYYNPDKSKAYYLANKELILAKAKERRSNGDVRKKQLLSVARWRAEQKGREFTLAVEDLEWPSVCPLLGIPINYFSNKNGPDSPSIDRRDNSKGYTKENCWVISNRANSIKRDATVEELELIASKLKLLQ